MPGRKPDSRAICEATNWLRASVEIRSPWPSAGTRNVQLNRSSATHEPRSGTSNSVIEISAQPRVAMMPSTKYGTSLPSRISTMPAGVDMTASIVPRSHSRATTSAVSNVPIMVMTIAMAPGIRKRLVSISGLNQKRGSKRTGRKPAILPAPRLASQFSTTPSE